MPLFQLPPEILASVFEGVGSGFFQEDLRRLTVSKQWKSYAFDALFRAFKLTPEILGRLGALPSEHPSRKKLETSLRLLSVELHGFRDWDPAVSTGRSSALEPRNDTDTDSEDDRAVAAARDTWTVSLHSNLVHLGGLLLDTQFLSDLRVHATHEQKPWSMDYRRDYLYETAVIGLLDLRSLRSLEIDLDGSHAIRDTEQEDEPHLCSHISALLRNLTRLRVRTQRICPRLLAAPSEEVNPDLHELIINLNLDYILEGSLTSRSLARRCGSSGGSSLELRAELEDQAVRLAQLQDAPKLIRIVYHQPPIDEDRVFDATTNKRLELDPGAEWDDDGHSISGYSEPESEIVDSSASEQGY